MTRQFDHTDRIEADPCAQDARQRENFDVFSYHLFNSYRTNLAEPKACEKAAGELEEFYTDNFMRIRNGYGVASACVIDEDSRMRNIPMTHDRGRHQLIQRTFQAVPDLSHGEARPVTESTLQQGENTYQSNECERNHVQSQFLPMIPCLRNTVQDPRHIIPSWTRGGESTRDTLKQKEFMEKNGYAFDQGVWSKRQCGVPMH